MIFKLEATQTIHKYIEVEAKDEDEALEKANEMLGNGDILFDDEPFLDMECNLRTVENS